MNEYISTEEYLAREQMEMDLLMSEITFEQAHESIRECESLKEWTEGWETLIAEAVQKQDDAELGKYWREICQMYWRYLAKERADDWLANETDRRMERDRLRGIA